MAREFYMTPALTEAPQTAKLGAGTGAANNFSDADVGKLVQLVADSRYNLCAAGAEIEGVITSVEPATQNGYSIGGVLKDDAKIWAVADGLQATPGTGTIAVGDYVVAGTITAKGTALATFPKVCKATAAGNTLNYKWRVVSLYTAGTGVVGTTIVIEQI
jgi:hypothetical protein